MSAIRKAHRHRNHRTASSVVHHNIEDCGNPLQADALHFQRQLLSMVDGSCQADEYVGAQSRMYDKAKRSDTAKRHVLSRQKPIQKDEHQASGSLRYISVIIRMSTFWKLFSFRRRKRSSDVSHLFRRCNKRQSLSSKIAENVPTNLSQESTVFTTFQQCLRRQTSAPFEEREFK